MPKLFIGPVSKNIIDVCIQFVNNNDCSLGLIPSRRQIDYRSGYVGLQTRGFLTYVRQRVNNINNIILERDHAGPLQGKKKDGGLQSIEHDINEGFDIIHLDPFKKYPFRESCTWTAAVISLMSLVRHNIKFEIATESAIKDILEGELLVLLRFVEKEIGPDLFADVVRYVVVQSGTQIDGFTNINNFDSTKSKYLIKAVHNFGCLAKEHNGDFLSLDNIKQRFDLGLDGMNFGPELGILETQTVLDHVSKSHREYLLDFFESSYKWQKWLPTLASKLEKALYSGHYNFHTTQFQTIVAGYPTLKERIYEDSFVCWNNTL
jgi:hypothetical protein